ncbi:MAG: CoA pyrophosphatase [Desulfuromonas sp.]|nr:MAG: CoA pyrophosphatase [Desulfuromonas sp.]
MLTIDHIRDRLSAYRPRSLSVEVRRHAAVAMLLRENNGGIDILLIRRAEHEKDPWSGDLGFPGGGIEDQDASPQAAAERETWEEIGVRLTPENYLGRTDDLAGAYLSVRISCFVYLLDGDTDFKLNGEVVDLFWIPLTTLLEPERNRIKEFYYRGANRKHPVVVLDEWSARPLWGITYRLINDFLNLFRLSFHHIDATDELSKKED